VITTVLMFIAFALCRTGTGAVRADRDRRLFMAGSVGPTDAVVIDVIHPDSARPARPSCRSPATCSASQADRCSLEHCPMRTACSSR
jgi:hypothetical protein